MMLPEHKSSFLKSVGFTQTYKDEPKLSMIDKMVNMEKWELTDEYKTRHQLYIHFIEGEPAYCNLYSGELDKPEIFSERNLVSQMKKRGFNHDKN